MNYLDLFSGIGGFHLGLKSAGFKFNWTGHSEIDKYANQVYREHFSESKDLGDISKINVSRLPKINLVTFGFPCQDLSIAGKRGGLGSARSGLFFEAMRIIRAARPEYFIFENVKGLFSSSEGRDFELVLREIADTGYDGQWQLLNTRWFLPQNRERIYFVGHLRENSRPQVFPIGEGYGNNEQARQFKDGLFCQALDSSYHKGPDGKRTMIQVGNVDTKGHNSLWGRVYSPEGDSATLNAKGGGMGAKTGLYEVSAIMNPDFKLKNQNGRTQKEPGEPMFTLTEQDRHGIEIHNLQIRGADRPSLTRICDCGSNKLYKKCCGTDGGHGHLSKKDGTTYALDSQCGQGVNIKSRIRRLTPVECARLQGFPDDWCEGLSDTQQYKCYGNAVSVPVVEAIGKRLIS